MVFYAGETEKVARGGNKFADVPVVTHECDRLKNVAAGVIVVAVELSHSTSTY